MKYQLHEPKDIRQQIWKELGRASVDRHHAWRTPVLATVGCDGLPNARTVVLRKVDANQQTLCVYTDARSAKVSELAKEPEALFAFWSPRLNWQLRVKVAMVVTTDGPELEAIWQQVQQSAAAADYMATAAPGTERPEAYSSADTRSGDHHFALLNASVLEIDWLELGQGGHRRARLSADNWQWLIP
jgi:pyridoxine/pyridoxamine 5'-phosphate oxidase